MGETSVGVSRIWIVKSKVLHWLSAEEVWTPVESRAFTHHLPGTQAGKSTVNEVDVAV